MSSLYRKVRLYSFCIILVLTTSFAGVSFILIWQEAQIDETRDRNAAIHVPTMLHTAKVGKLLVKLGERMQADIADIEAHVGGEGHGAHLVPSHLQKWLYVIGKELDSIADLQASFGGARYERTLKKIAVEYGALRSAFEIESSSLEVTGRLDGLHHQLGRLRALALSVRQLERLHVISYDDVNQLLESQVWRRNAIVFPAAVLILFSALIGLMYLTSRTRDALVLQEKADHALRENEERLKQTIQLSGLGYWVWDAVKERCAYCSEEYARIHGTTPDDYIARAAPLDGTFTWTHPEDREELRAALKALRAGREVEMEYRVVTPSGQVRHIQEIAKPIFDETGTVVQEHGTAQDVTERKEAEEQLRQAQKMEAIGQLTGGVAHDFNNLLAVIMGNAEVLAARLGDDNKPAQAVIRAATRGAELVGRLLAFSRTQPLSPQSVNIDAVVTEMSSMLHRTLGETVEIEIRIAPDLWRALADPGQLESAILNLAINAQHAMPNGGKLTIECANAPLNESYTAGHMEVIPGDYVMLAVSDTGTGMDPEVLEHAFEPFFTTKDVGAGSGLGLSMVYGFAKQSDGEVSIHSEEGRGTTVRLYLPRATTAADKAERNASTKDPSGRGETILVVEDDPDVRELAEVVLENLRYRVLTAQDGRTGLAALEKAPGVDLLLSDVVLPGGMSGPDLAEQVRHHSPGLKVLFMSGYAVAAAQHHSLLPENAAVLKKPFRMNELAQKVRAVLDRRGALDS